MLEFLQRFFGSDGFMPHGHCYQWSRGVVWLHVVSDVLIAIAYYSIPLTLAWFVRRRRDLDFRWMFICFALFVLACGTTHVMEVWNVWHSNYWLAGAIKALTAAASLPTAILLTRLMPKALAQPSPAMLHRANANLRQEVAARIAAEASLREANATLESRVAERTAQLQATNAELQREISERKLAQEAVRQSDERFQLATQDHYLKREFYNELRANPAIIEFLEAEALDGVWYWDMEKPENEWLSPNFWRTLGYDPAEKQHLASEWKDIIFPEDLVTAEENFHRHCADQRHPFDQLVRYRHKDGSTVHIRCHGMAIRDAAGKPVRMLGAHNDVTATLREQARRVSEQYFRSFFERAAVGAVQTDPQGKLVRVNQRFCEITGYSPEELLGRDSTTFDHPDEREAESEKIARFLRGEVPLYEQEKRYVRKNGEVVWVHATAAPIYDVEGRIVSTAGIVVDITERKRAEAALRESEEQFRSTFEQAAVGMAHVSPDGRFLKVNQRYADIVGRTREELHTYTFQQITHPEDLDADVALYQRLLAGEILTYSIEKRYLRPDSSPVWVNLTGSLVRADTGAPKYFIAVVEEISARKAVEAQVQQLNANLEQRVKDRTAQLESANQELEAFSYSVSHDLRTPLRAVDGFSQAVLEDYGAQLPEEGRRYLATIRQGAQRMGALIDDLLTFSRLSRLPLIKRAVDTARLVHQAIEELGPQRAGRLIEIRIGDLPACHGDPALLKQVWVNLLSNAFKYTRKREAAVVEIGCEHSPEGDVYFVRDNGVGFDMRYAGKLFAVFQRLHRMEDYDGTGVGLALVQRVIHRHGGRVWADAAVDCGATFYFTLAGGTNL